MALCLTVPSESLSRVFKLAPMPGNKTFTRCWFLVGRCSLSGVHVTGEESFLSLELHLSQILVNGTFVQQSVYINELKVIIVQHT